MRLPTLTRGHLELGLATVIVLLSVGFCYQERQSAANQARAEIAEQTADSLYVVVEESTAVLEAVNAEANAQIRAAEERRVDAEERAARVVQARPTVVREVVTQLVQAGADSSAVEVAIEQLEESHAEEVSALRVALAAADTVIAAQRVQLAATLRVNADLRSALEASRAEATAWERAATPRLLGFRVSPGVAFVLGASATTAVFLIGAGVL